jgi:flagellar hook-associated protein 1 FlgK
LSLNDILGSALSGLSATQAGMRTVSNNIANVGTPGYARERVSLTTGVTAGRVTGVLVSEPSRVADRFLEATVYARQSEQARSETTASYLDRLQSLLGTPGSESGLPARLNAIGAAAVAMTGSVASEQTVRSFTSNVQDAIVSMQQLDRDVGSLRGEVETEVSYTIDRINSLLERIHNLNDTVARLDGLGRSSSGAGDQRMTAIEELSGLMKITVRDQPDGRVSIDTANGVALLDRRLRQLSYPAPADGISQPTYPSIDIRFVEADGSTGAATGEKIDSPAVGGKLGGLLDLRDRSLPQFSEQLGAVFRGLSEALNAVANDGTTVPAPNKLEGRQTGLVGGDRLGFTGVAQFGVTSPSGVLIAKTVIDFDALGPNATVDDAIAAINAGLGGTATASFANGKLNFTASAGANGVIVAQDPGNPSSRAGVGFSHFFGLNDIVTSEQGTLVPTGFVASDPHGFTTGQTTEIVLRDPNGRTIAKQVLSPTSGGTIGDLINDLNSGPLSSFGTFSLDSRGRFRFSPDVSIPGVAISIPADSTDRFGTGRSLASLASLTGATSGLDKAEVRPDILNSAGRLPLARFRTDVAVGTKAIGAGDNRGATQFVDFLTKPMDLGKDGLIGIEGFASLVLGRAGMQAAQANDLLADATARRDDAVNRRDSFSGVNVDEELAQLVVLQNSYSAAARVMSTASEMYDTLIAMVG